MNGGRIWGMASGIVSCFLCVWAPLPGQGLLFRLFSRGAACNSEALRRNAEVYEH